MSCSREARESALGGNEFECRVFVSDRTKDQHLFSFMMIPAVLVDTGLGLKTDLGEGGKC